jgi:hypothetical protein
MWAAVREVWPQTREQACWYHKPAVRRALRRLPGAGLRQPIKLNTRKSLNAGAKFVMGAPETGATRYSANDQTPTKAA